MNFRNPVASLALAALAAAAVACSAASPDAGDQAAEQDISAAATQIVGSWTIDASSAGLSSTVAYDFRPDGSFFRDSKRILNGIFLPGARPPLKRESGTFTVSKSKGLVTLHIDSPAPATEVLAYVYTPAKILNGVCITDACAAHPATLALTEQPAPMSHVAFPTITYDHADSYCTSNADCGADAPTCNTDTSTCRTGCIDVIACVKGSHWDSTACTCVPDEVPFCAPGALGSGSLQPGAAGGPDARANVACAAGYSLCQIDPNGSDNDVCGDAFDCFACTK